MNLQRHCLHAALAAAAISVAAWPAYGQLEFLGPPKATLLDVRLSEDGSADPPGDRLVADVLLYAGTDRVDLVVEAQAVSVAPARPAVPTPPPVGEGPAPVAGPAESAWQVRPVEVKDPAFRGADGRFRIRTTVKGLGRAGVVTSTIVVPHAALALAPGDEKVRYTVRGEVRGAEVFFKTTRLVPAPSPNRLTQMIVVDEPDEGPAEVLTPAPAPGTPDRVLISRVGGRGPEVMPPALPPMAAAPPLIDAHEGPLPSPQAPSKVLPAPAPAPQAPTMVLPAPAPAPQAGDAGTQAPPLDQAFTAMRKRPVLFATNRTVRAAAGTPSARFGDGVDRRVHYGSCLVNVPVDAHIQGVLELPGRFSRDDPTKSFLIDATATLDDAAFRAIVAGGDARHDVLVYVHGFNTPFDFAVMRLAQIVQDIRFPGVPVVFSWPSHGSPDDYDRDEKNAESEVTIKALAGILRELADVQAARPAERRGKVHIIAHSLGSRVTLRALGALDAQLAAGATPFGQIIMVAPDVGVGEFNRRLPAARRRADRLSLYSCPADRALMASEVRHPGEPRAGRGVVPVDGLDNIDARKANTSFLGHGYWAEVKQVLIDLQMTINLGWPPDQRVYTLDAIAGPPRFWQLR